MQFLEKALLAFATAWLRLCLEQLTHKGAQVC